MPSDDPFEKAWVAIEDDELFKGIIRDWARSRQQRIAAERAADRMRGENLTFQLKYGRPMPTVPPMPMNEQSFESSEEPAATLTSDDSPPPEDPQPEETPKEKEERMKTTIPKPDADAVREASATDIVSSPPKKEREAKPEPKPKAKAKETATKKRKKKKADVPSPPKGAVEANEKAIASFAEGREPKERMPLISSMTEPSVINDLMDRAEEGDEAARKHLYNSMGDLEDHHPDAAERYEDLFGKQFILKDPFANPFHNPNYLETVQKESGRTEYVAPVIKSEPLEESKPDIGFDVVEGDDLSLLPASLFAKDVPGGDDMSLLPSGWKSDQ